MDLSLPDFSLVVYASSSSPLVVRLYGVFCQVLRLARASEATLATNGNMHCSCLRAKGFNHAKLKRQTCRVMVNHAAFSATRFFSVPCSGKSSQCPSAMITLIVLFFSNIG